MTRITRKRRHKPSVARPPLPHPRINQLAPTRASSALPRKRQSPSPNRRDRQHQLPTTTAPIAVMDGVRWRTRTGAPWRRDVPAQYDKWETVYGLFRRWQRVARGLVW
ncbi:transposase [Streptomyces sp. ISL-99]|uniref:transposase n=1 Tax=Streptomyces sp. ISL-99 TaxID=2819193 RepID=UPI0027E5978F|nr:transposase [Streptomyces sp. ISL-99]